MIEVTDEMVMAYAKAWDAADPAVKHRPERVRSAISAVLAVVERDLSAGWLIWSNEHQMWWKANRAGYTADMMCAGRYTLDEALAETGTRKTTTGLPGEVAIRAPHIALIGDRDLAGKMRAAIDVATKAAGEQR